MSLFWKVTGLTSLLRKTGARFYLPRLSIDSKHTHTHTHTLTHKHTHQQGPFENTHPHTNGALTHRHYGTTHTNRHGRTHTTMARAHTHTHTCSHAYIHICIQHIFPSSYLEDGLIWFFITCLNLCCQTKMKRAKNIFI